MIFSFDGETSSEAPLQTVGAEAYINHPSTRALYAAFHPVGRPDQPVLWVEGDPPPYALIGHVANGGSFAGWNVTGFDRLMWNRILVLKHGFPPVPDDNWIDSMHRAAAANLPRSLDGCASAVGLGFKVELKDSNRIRRVTDAKRTSIPAPVRTILDNPGAYEPKLVDDLRWLAERCVQDVLMEEQVLMRLPPWPDMEPWLHMPAIDRTINDRGVLIDVKLVEGLARAAATELQRLNGEMARVTDEAVTATTKIEDIKRWLIARGVPVPLKTTKQDPDDDEEDSETPTEKGSPWRLRKNDIANLLSLDLPDDCREVLFMRSEAAKTSVSKLRAALRSVSDEGRLCGMILLMGAQATGRFSSKIVQIHNLVRDAFGKDYENIAAQNGLNKNDKIAIKIMATRALRTAIEAGQTGDADLIRCMYQEERKDLQGRKRVEGVLPWISRMMRRIIAAPDGQLLLNGDFANIEARIPVWLAGQQDTVDAFARGEDLYRVQAAPVYGLAPETLTDEQRQIGKVMRLFLGFGGGVNAFIPAAMNYGLSIPREQGLQIVQIFRQTNAPLVEYWDANLNAAIWAVMYPGREYFVPPTGLISWKLDGACLLCRLPSGRYLHYWAPRLEQGFWEDGAPKQQLDLTVIAIKGKAAFRRTLWRGLAVENLTQAIACDLLCVALANMQREGFSTTIHVHDSIAAEVDENQADALMPVFKGAMLDMPSWVAGLPMAAGVDAGARFG